MQRLPQTCVYRRKNAPAPTTRRAWSATGTIWPDTSAAALPLALGLGDDETVDPDELGWVTVALAVGEEVGARAEDEADDDCMLLDWAGHVRLNPGVVVRFAAMEKSGVLGAGGSVRMYQNVFTLPKRRLHPTVYQ